MGLEWKRPDRCQSLAERQQREAEGEGLLEKVAAVNFPEWMEELTPQIQRVWIPRSKNKNETCPDVL